mmetsp:Transcript_8415/g.20120  ORF Transcript_8415/g.20120 Transcript_8415/m.20120 type:complete len:273 (-) Transcript_8415:347-1165(-)
MGWRTTQELSITDSRVILLQTCGDTPALFLRGLERGTWLRPQPEAMRSRTRMMAGACGLSQSETTSVGSATLKSDYRMLGRPASHPCKLSSQSWLRPCSRAARTMGLLALPSRNCQWKTLTSILTLARYRVMMTRSLYQASLARNLFGQQFGIRFAGRRTEPSRPRWQSSIGMLPSLDRRDRLLLLPRTSRWIVGSIAQPRSLNLGLLLSAWRSRHRGAPGCRRRRREPAPLALQKQQSTATDEPAAEPPVLEECGQRWRTGMISRQLQDRG